MGKSQIEILANYIMFEVPGEPSQDEGAGECAVRIIKKLRRANKELALLLMAISVLVFVVTFFL